LWAAEIDSLGMTTFEYALNLALVGPVVLQIRGIKLTAAALVVPVAMTAWAASQILHSIPTGGNDVALEVAFGCAGGVLGLLAGLATSVRRDGAAALAKAGGVAALLWVVGIGARVGFSVWVQHGGAVDVRTFSLAHDITGGPVWGAGFVLMALTEVVCRTAVLYVKARRSGAIIERGGLIRRFVAA
jgi:hypothetical protein